MFGRKRKRQQEEAAADAAREVERHALFAQLATRPENVCPFLGLADDRVGFEPGVTPEHRCYAFGDPAPLSGDQQSKVCLDRGYGNCPRYLRGVLVIPTDELEALRRPAPASSSAPPPSAARPRPEQRRRRPIAAWLIGLLLLLVVAGVGGVALLGGGLPPFASASATPTVVPSETLDATPSTGPSETPPPPTPTPTMEPTPAPNAEFIGYEVAVSAGDYVLFVVDAGGDLGPARDATFDALSKAAVERIEAPNGQLHWRTDGGGYDGLSYIRGRSGDFAVREVYRAPDGSLGYERLPDEET